MKIDRADVLIVNSDTPLLTNIAIASAFRQISSFGFEVSVFDNSDAAPFEFDGRGRPYAGRVRVIDNFGGKMIDFCAECNRARGTKLRPEDFAGRRQGSFKHSLTVQRFLDEFAGDNVLLLDSDVIVRRDPDFCDDDFVTAAEPELNPLRDQPGVAEIRLRPFIQYFNAKQMRRLGLKYFDPAEDQDWGRSGVVSSLQCDTGTAFLMRCLRTRNISIRHISCPDYVYHMFAGTRRFEQCDVAGWIEKAKPYI